MYLLIFWLAYPKFVKKTIMKLIADFHIHSHYSRATSKQLTPEYLELFGRKKGINVIGTGDFTHPGWLDELQQKLQPAEQGLFKLKEEFRLKEVAPKGVVRFMLTSEISNIYKKHDKTRKVHNVICAPDFQTVHKINHKLESIGGNLKSDGRPILGLDSRDLLEIALEANEHIFFIPAHIWTPWFSALGAKSGFDSIHECYDDLTKYIHAVETGLSTDPAMNWMISELDQFTLLSNSDAHSPDKLGRNANWFDTELNYDDIIEAMRNGGNKGFKGTIDMFPQEGKYHYAGHRKCKVCLNPVEVIEAGGICPVCGKKLTEGVMNRVAELSDRKELSERKNRKPFYSIIPLREMLAGIEGVGPNSKRVGKQFEEVLKTLGNEMHILLEKPVDDISQQGFPLLAEGIERMRARKVYIQEGYDGEYGKITVFKPGEIREMQSGDSLFNEDAQNIDLPEERPLLNFDLEALQRLHHSVHLTRQSVVQEPESPVYEKQHATGPLSALNSSQEKAALHESGPAMVLAGPGTGKTKTLTAHVYSLIHNGLVPQKKIATITFTNKAAGEIKARLADLLQTNEEALQMTTNTFHGLGFIICNEHAEDLQRKTGFMLIDPDETVAILQQLTGEKLREVKQSAVQISLYKQNIVSALSDADIQLLDQYEDYLISNNLFDLDDLLYRPVKLLKENKEISKQWQQSFSHILVDEYQDTNPVQYELLNQLIDGANSNLYVVGDPNQAIYGFRGASVKYMRRFVADFPQATIYRLQQSYRCSQRILASSANVLSSETSALKGINEGVKIKISAYASGAAEAEGIARKIEVLTGGMGFFSKDSQVVASNDDAEVSLSDIAILMRTRRQSDALKKALKDHHIPFQEAGEEPFWKKTPWSIVINLLNFRYYQLPHLQKELKAETFSLVQEIPENEPAAETLKFITNRLRADYEFDQTQYQMMRSMAEGLDCKTFLTRLKTGWGADAIDNKLEAVQLLTMHAAKGLEFDTVFIPGLEDGIMPFNMFRKQVDTEEEERLLYVAMTRAKGNLWLSHANQRFLFNQQQKLKVSPFLKRINKALTEQFKEKSSAKQKADGNQLKLF